MHIYVKREKAIKNSTPGKGYIDGDFFCHTLEPLVRADGIKIAGQTAIPAGEYLIRMYQSPHFGRVLPMLINVPMFSYVLLHALNRVSETLACIGVGFQRGLDPDGSYVIWESRKAEDYLVKEMLDASRRSVLAITIEDADD
jgi:hypothetical protein